MALDAITSAVPQEMLA
jgi:hypothetical protein